jgi:hypothetical protein
MSLSFGGFDMDHSSRTDHLYERIACIKVELDFEEGEGL